MKILKERGITLVALVITIIVLLILAGVTLSLVLGDSGVVTKADEAKTVSNQKEIEEQVKLKVQENITAHEGEFDIEDFWSEIASDGFTVDSSKKEVTKAGVTLSVGTKGEVAVVNGETIEVEELQESPAEWFIAENIAYTDGIAITGLNTSVLEKRYLGGESYSYYYNDELVTRLVIPAEIGNKPVVSIGIGISGSKDYGYIDTVILPEGLEEIKSYAFYGFRDLNEIVIPSTVTRVGNLIVITGLPDSYGNMQTVKVVGRSEKPSGWDNNWCPSGVEVIWNYSE